MNHSFARFPAIAGLFALLGVALLTGTPQVATAQPGTATSSGVTAPAWHDAKTVALDGMQVTLSKPALVARSQGYLWFPSLIRLTNGDCMAVMSSYADMHVETAVSAVSWSHDGGLTWTKPIEGQYGDASLKRPGDDELLLPYYLKPLPDGSLGGPYQLCPKRKQELRLVKEGVVLSGLPKPAGTLDAKLGLAGFVFNGQTVKLKNGSYLANLYGYFKDEDRYSLLAAESVDGVKWTWKSTIAGKDCPLEGKEGPCESATCRLADGRLMCVFRMAANVPYGQSFSADEGKTWSEPVAMKGVQSVQPSLAVLPNGMVALSGGRPGIFLWLNTDKTGTTWQRVDVMAHHNETIKDEPIKEARNTSAYTEVVVLDDTHLLLIYDRIPHSWSAIPEGSADTNSVWVVRVTLAAKPAAGT